MAKLIQAVARYGPRLDKLQTVGVEDIAESIARRTGLNISEVMMMIQESNEVILEFNRDGRPVRFPGVGIFTPSIRRDGQLGRRVPGGRGPEEEAEHPQVLQG